MDYTEKIKYLSQLKDSNAMLKSLLEERVKWFTLATKVNTVSDGMPHSPSEESKVENNSIRILELNEKIDEEIKHMVDVRWEIGELISHIQNVRHRTVMSMRYISGYTFPRIAEALEISDRAVFKIHRMAVNRLEIHGRKKNV